MLSEKQKQLKNKSGLSDREVLEFEDLIVEWNSTWLNKSKKELYEIAKEATDRETLKHLAFHKNSSRKTLKIVLDKTSLFDEEVLKLIASNKNADEEVLKGVLDKNSNLFIIYIMIKEQFFLAETVLKKILEKTDDEEVLASIISHPNSSKNLLIEILLKFKGDLTSSVVSTEEGPLLVVENLVDETVFSLSFSFGDFIDPKILKGVVAETENKHVLGFVANHKNSDEEVLEQILMKTNDLFVLSRVASSVNATAGVLEKVVDLVSDDLVFSDVVYNKNVSAVVLNKIAEKTSRLEVLDLIAKHPKTSNMTMIRMFKKGSKKAKQTYIGENGFFKFLVAMVF